MDHLYGDMSANGRTRLVAAELRNAKRRGARAAEIEFMSEVTVAGMTVPEILKIRAELEALRPPLTVATIRKCKEQLMNNKPFVPEPTDPCKRCRAPQWAHDDHEALSCGNFIPEGPQ